MTVESTLLAGDCALITGGAQGNGAAIARGLARHSAAVVIADLDGDGANRVAKEIREAGGKALGLVLDVSDAQACRAAADTVLQELGAVSVLVNNAGIVRKTDPHAADFLDLVQLQLKVNAMGYANMVHAVLAQLVQRQGRIINIASIMSFLSYEGSTGYAVSKGAVKQLTVGLASDLAKDGIRVNAVAPGFFETRMTQVTRADPALLARRLDHIPMHRMGLPEELVGPVVFLASSLSSYMTGTVLAVDGGYLAV